MATTHAPHRPAAHLSDPAKSAKARIYPYDPPRALADGLWQVKGSLQLSMPRNMTVYRLPEGGLLLYSVIAMHEEGMRALEALGTPAIMVMPHDRHQMDAPFYKQRYPNLRVLAPDPNHARRVKVNGGLEELEVFGIRAYSLPGASFHEAVLELPLARGVALCACELLGNASPEMPWLMKVAMKVFGPPGGGFGVVRIARWREVVDRPAMQAWLRGLSARSDIRLLLVGHGPPVTADAQASLEHAANGA